MQAVAVDRPAETSAPRAMPRWWLRLRRDRSFWWSSVGLGLLVVAIVVGPWLSPYTEREQTLAEYNQPPRAEHWFGNDALGRDLLTRVFYGGRISLAVGIVGALVSLVIGVGVGGIAGFAGGMTERLILRLIDFLYAVPLLLVVIGLRVVMGGGLGSIFLALGLVYWLQMARVVRVRVAELRSREFAEAARALGAGPLRVLVRHVLPNTTGIVVVTATFMIPQAIFAEAFLSFIGLGVEQPHASWGTLASEGLEAMRAAPHILAFPAAAICLTMFLFQAFGEALRAALDPRGAEGD
jgi:oligopeptide transport system permease protein